MGVPGLWEQLKPAAKVRSLTELAVVEGFEANPNGCRGFRLGIDASIWFFHAAYGQGGKNPELRLLFFRCAKLLRIGPFLPIFVFDGPLRRVKRNKEIREKMHPLQPGGNCRALGEAEAELAYLNRVGVIDGILSDDVDNFLFGATAVIRNPSNNLSGNLANPAFNSDGKVDDYHTHVYRLQDITEHPDVLFTRGDMIFVALCSGGDYDTTGMTGCGPNIAKGLVRYGFGRSLYEAAKNLSRHELDDFLHGWRNKIRHELCSDSKGYIRSKRRALASSLPDTFPDITILLSYVHPITLEWSTRDDYLDLTWAKEPNLAKLATTCQLYFGWSAGSLIKRFKAKIWEGAVLRILRRGILDLEEKRRRGDFVQSTPTKNGKPGAQGTPSKLIKEHFSSKTFNPAEDDDDDRLITGITRTREHTSTDGILEYRLEIRPRLLVLLAESELGNRHRADGGSEEERRAMEKGLRVWMPASIVRMAEPRLVEEFEQREAAKRPKKAGKRTETSTTKRQSEIQVSEDEQPDAPKFRSPSALLVLHPDGSYDDELPTFQLDRVARAKGKQTAGASKGVRPTKTADPFVTDPPARVVRDLTKNKGKAVDNSQTDQNNSFLPKAIGHRGPRELILEISSPPTTYIARTPLKLRPQPFPLALWEEPYCPSTPSRIQGSENSDVGDARSDPLRPLFEDRPLPKRRNSDRDSDCEPRLAKSPRKSRQHISPRITAHASSSASSRHLESAQHYLIEMSSDSDASDASDAIEVQATRILRL
ncbi:hypothetical protein C8R45DRAFT_1056519 [Mycena sanguinolenta]|nr:hypothetical protein C8R45DRAFT_1056519 [Mycena sanguinolenta]